MQLLNLHRMLRLMRVSKLFKGILDMRRFVSRRRLKHLQPLWLPSLGHDGPSQSPGTSHRAIRDREHVLIGVPRSPEEDPTFPSEIECCSGRFRGIEGNSFPELGEPLPMRLSMKALPRCLAVFSGLVFRNQHGRIFDEPLDHLVVT